MNGAQCNHSVLDWGENNGGKAENAGYPTKKKKLHFSHFYFVFCKCIPFGPV